MNYLRTLIIPLCLSAAPLLAQGHSMFNDPNDPVKIIVHNRVLAKVNGQAITVMDVMKKMDVLFFQQFPEYSGIKVARHQFYTTNWKFILQDLINKELILADAQETKIPITAGDVRQELEEMFGPNVIANLDKVGLSMEDAKKMIEKDITIRRTVAFRVNQKAVRQVNPQDIKLAYEDYAKKNVRPPEWIYYVISIKDKDPENARKAANIAYQELVTIKVPLEELSKVLEGQIADSTSVNVSSEFRHKETEMSEAYKENIFALETDEYSRPALQKSRNDKTTLYRLFYLKDKVPGSIVPFQEVADMLRNELIQKNIEKETAAYIKKLRDHFAVSEADLKAMSPEEFEPFVLQTKRG